MKQFFNYPFASEQRLATQAFETHIPRLYNDQWMADTTGPIDFGWDKSAIQIGFLDPLYRYFDLQPQRWAPTLTSLLLKAQGYEPAKLDGCLAATELFFLSGLMLREDIARSQAQAYGISNIVLPMPVHVTLAYTSRQLTPILVSLQKTGFTDYAKSWLVYRFTRALSAQEIRLVGDLLLQKQQVAASGTLSLQHRLNNVGFFAFELALDTALAATGIYQDETIVARLRVAVKRLSGIYVVLGDLLEPEFASQPEENGFFYEENGVRLDQVAGMGTIKGLLETEMTALHSLLEEVPAHWAQPLWHFASSLLEPGIIKVSNNIYA